MNTIGAHNDPVLKFCNNLNIPILVWMERNLVVFCSDHYIQNWKRQTHVRSVRIPPQYNI